jgi:hypothetical protein
MPEPAGIVNEDGVANDAPFAQILGKSDPQIQTLARAVRDLVFDVLPQTVEVVWPKQGSVGWGTGPKKFTEQFAYMMPFSKHVTLGFYRGGELSDPQGLLPDRGGKQVAGTLSMRSMKLKNLEEVRRPALRSLIEASTRQGIPPAKKE